mmetsp:Transcript_15374/g.43627  ORF Transcript_15374/g.43627 Transcript_15374/m.43627 type:complete len:343 (+) Transcript_15374:756-1784(+)
MQNMHWQGTGLAPSGAEALLWANVVRDEVPQRGVVLLRLLHESHALYGVVARAQRQGRCDMDQAETVLHASDTIAHLHVETVPRDHGDGRRVGKQHGRRDVQLSREPGDSHKAVESGHRLSEVVECRQRQRLADRDAIKRAWDPAPEFRVDVDTGLESHCERGVLQYLADHHGEGVRVRDLESPGHVDVHVLAAVHGDGVVRHEGTHDLVQPERPRIAARALLAEVHFAADAVDESLVGSERQCQHRLRHAQAQRRPHVGIRIRPDLQLATLDRDVRSIEAALDDPLREHQVASGTANQRQQRNGGDQGSSPPGWPSLKSILGRRPALAWRRAICLHGGRRL